MPSDSPFHAPPTLALLMEGLEAETSETRILVLRVAEAGTTGRDADLRLVRPIGEGGMGRVDEAEQLALGRLVAVKRPRVDDPRTARQVMKEAWINGQLEHPNIAPVYLVGETEEGDPLVVMKRVEGQSWSVLLGTDDVPLERHLDIFEDVCNAVSFAHHKDVVHRDLKPSNVQVGDHGAVWLLDWGIAACTGEPTHGTGTLGYMAPEMFEPGPADPRSDIYLLGALLHRVLTGAAPHDSSSGEAARASARSAPELGADVPAGLARVCVRAMDPDPDRRFQSVDALLGAVRAWRDERVREQAVQGATRAADDFLADAAASAADPADLDLEAAARTSFAVWRFAVDGASRAGAELGELTARCRAAMVALELRAGAIGAATALAAEPGADEALRERVEREAAEQAVRAQELERLAGEGRRFDLSRDPRTFIASAVAIVVLLMGPTATMERFDLVDPEVPSIAMTVAAVVALVAVGRFVQARGHHLAGTVAISCSFLWAGFGGVRTLWVLGFWDWTTSFKIESAMAACYAFGLFPISGRLTLSAVPFLVALAVMFWSPDWSLYAYNTAWIAAVLSVGWAFRRSAPGSAGMG